MEYKLWKIKNKLKYFGSTLKNLTFLRNIFILQPFVTFSSDIGGSERYNL